MENGNLFESVEEGRAGTGVRWPTYVPKHINYQWVDPIAMVNMCTVSLECGGFVCASGIRAEVCEEGHSLRIMEDWPRQLVDSVLACHKWLKPGSTTAISNDHPHHVALEHSLRRLKLKILSPIRSVELLKLTFAVRQDVHMVHKSIFPFNGKVVKIVHVDLKSLTSDYAQENEDTEFVEQYSISL